MLLHILIFSATTGPNGTKLRRNVHWMVLSNVYGFFVHQKNSKEARSPKPKVSNRGLSVFNLLLKKLQDQ
jgi:hypothetical protein